MSRHSGVTEMLSDFSPKLQLRAAVLESVATVSSAPTLGLFAWLHSPASAFSRVTSGRSTDSMRQYLRASSFNSI